jgi:hypothetical protein
MANVAAIVIGILCIGALYVYPVYTFSSPLVGHYSFTVSSIASLCDNPFMALLGGSSCEFYKGIFYLGWIGGIILIFYGLSQK